MRACGRARRYPLRIRSPPGGAWMLGKPIQIAEARDLYRSGLKIVSCYQYGKQDNADWLAGEPAGIQHAQRGWQLHVAAGGPIAAPIYTSIDDDPTFEQYKRQVAPYLRGWERVLGRQRVGVYANSKTIEWALQDGLGLVLLAAQLGLARAGRTPGRPPPPGGDRQARGGRCRCRHQPHSQAQFRAVGLRLTDRNKRQQTICRWQLRTVTSGSQVVAFSDARAGRVRTGNFHITICVTVLP